MKKKQILTLLLALALVLSITACSGTAATTEAPSAEPAAPEASAPETEAPASPDAPAPEEATDAPEAPAAQTGSITYPLEGDHSFTMVSVLRMNTAEAMGENDYTVTPCYDAMKEATGVSIEFNLLGEATYSEKMNLMMASGELPDFFSQTVSQYDSNLIGALEDNILIDLAPMLDEHAPDYKALLDEDENFAAGVYNSDGTICQFVGRIIPRTTSGFFIRGDWLEKLGAEAPATIDELTELLRRFKDECGASSPLLANYEIDCGLAPYFGANFMGFRGVNYQLTAPGSGEVVCCYASEGFIDYISYLRDLYAEGLIGEDFLNIGKEFGNWESSYYTGVCGIWTDDCKYADPAFAENANDPNWEAVPFALTGEENHLVMNGSVGMSGKLYITTSCAEPEIAMEYVNYAYTDAGKDLVAFGVKDLTYTVDADGHPQYTDLMLNNPDGWSFDTCNVFYTPSQWLPTDQQQSYLDLQYGSEATAAYKLWTDESGDDTMTLPLDATLTSTESADFSNYSGDVLTLFSEVATRVVVGTSTIEDYRQAIEDAKAIGLTEMDALYQHAYERALES